MENNQTSTQYAGFWIRYFARMIDNMLLFLVFFFPFWMYSFFVGSLSGLLSASILYIALLFLYLIYVWLYYSLTTHYWGATIGKRIAGIEVQTQSGSILSLKQSVFRHTIGYWLSTILFGAGYFWVTRDAKKQGWHDQAAGTFVVKKNPEANKTFVTALLGISLVISYFGIIIWAGYNVGTNQKLRADFQNEINIIKEYFNQDYGLDLPAYTDNEVTVTAVPLSKPVDVELVSVRMDGKTYYPGDTFSIKKDCMFEVTGTLIDINSDGTFILVKDSFTKNSNNLVSDIDPYVVKNGDYINKRESVLTGCVTVPNRLIINTRVVADDVNPKRGSVEVTLISDESNNYE